MRHTHFATVIVQFCYTRCNLITFHRDGGGCQSINLLDKKNYYTCMYKFGIRNEVALSLRAYLVDWLVGENKNQIKQTHQHIIRTPILRCGTQ